jgi:hypothetical protein
MDSASRLQLELRRDWLMAEVRRLDKEKLARIREVTTDPSFDPTTHTMDAQVARLVSQQGQLISQLEEIDRELRG